MTSAAPSPPATLLALGGPGPWALPRSLGTPLSGKYSQDFAAATTLKLLRAPAVPARFGEDARS